MFKNPWVYEWNHSGILRQENEFCIEDIDDETEILRGCRGFAFN